VIAGHAPYIGLHAGLTYFKAAAAPPAESQKLTAAMALLLAGAAPAALAGCVLVVRHVALDPFQ